MLRYLIDQNKLQHLSATDKLDSDPSLPLPANHIDDDGDVEMS